jgi:RNA polymerase sigma-70 factor (ECF subfamily)
MLMMTQEPDRQASRTAGPAAAMTETFYAELRQIAGRIFASERTGHTLQPTAVVNEACMRIMSGGLPDVPREQQLALAGRVLKQVLIDHSRRHNAAKRGGPPGGGGEGEGGARGGKGGVRLSLDDGVLAEEPALVDFESIHRALERLRRLSERQAEVVTLRIFAGLTMDQIAAVLDISKRSVEGDWAVARAWLRRELGGEAESQEEGR